MSDSDEQVALPKPKFKKKAFSRQNRRQKDADWDEPGHGSVFSSSKLVSTPGVAKWEKFKGLRNIQADNGTMSGQDDSTFEEVKHKKDDEAPPAMEPLVEQPLKIQPLENTAYTTLDMPNTFTLKSTHFRDGSQTAMRLEKEYADAYGNVSDEEVAPAGDILHDQVQEFSDIDGEDEIYDSELSVEATSPHAPGLLRIAAVKEWLEMQAQVARQSEELRLEMAANERRLGEIKHALAACEERRLKVVEEL